MLHPFAIDDRRANLGATPMPLPEAWFKTVPEYSNPIDLEDQGVSHFSTKPACGLKLYDWKKVLSGTSEKRDKTGRRAGK
jgi:hypothetical protein